MTNSTFPTKAADVTLADLEAVGEWEQDRVEDLRAECASRGSIGSTAEDIARDILFTHFGDDFAIEDAWNLIEEAAAR